MKKWLKRALAVTVSTGFIATNTFTQVSAQSQTNITSKSFTTQINQWQVPQNKKSSSQSALSKDTLVIKFTKPLTQTEHRLAGGSLIKQFSDLNYAVVKVKDQKNVDKIIGNYLRNQKVVAVTPSAIYQPSAVADPKAGDQYQNQLLQLAKAQQLAGKNKVIVAVIDQGIDRNHPDLKGVLLPSYNAVNPMNQGTPDFHGTHVAGIVAANKDNGIGGYGVSPNAKILPIDVFDRNWGASDYSIAQGILYAVDHGAKVINMSLSGYMPSPLIEEAIKKALAKNVTIVAAAGNTGDMSPQYPAAIEGVISVGSINKEKKLSSYSTYGTSIDVVAPGEDIYSTIYEPEKKSSFRKLSGTSMASPMVVGVAALLLSKYPKLTPYQVEYILEHTAQDLGDSGFDIKYGNGLINPVAALNFDTKKLPSIVNKPLSEKERLEKAEAVTIKGKSSVAGKITKAFEEKWYKTDVKKGDYLQFMVDGAAQYDYKLLIVQPGEKTPIEVNNVREGKTEGKLIKAAADGTIVFGVKDVNGAYDDSGKGLSKYTLIVEKASTLPDDENSLEKPTDIEMPYNGVNGASRLIGEEGDDDFYRFSLKEQQTVKITLGEVPGVDTSISVYMGDQLYPSEGEAMAEGEEGLVTKAAATKRPADEASEDKKEQAPDENQIPPAYYSNNGGYSEGETLTFTAEPEMQYVVKISNKKDNNFGIFDFFMNPGLMNNDQSPESSLEPYTLKVEGKVLPPDEDVFPTMGEKTDETSSAVEKTKEVLNASDMENEYDQYIKMIKDESAPYSLGENVSGYLQMLEDEDWFKLSPSDTGIYQFNFKEAAANIPMAEVYRIVEETDDKGKVTSYLDYMGSNMTSDWFSGRLNPSLYVGMKHNETYYLKLSTNFFTHNISFDPYQFSAKLVIKNPQDAYEDNDDLKNVKINLLPKLEGNFAMPNDMDAFYLQSKESQIYGVTFGRKQIDEKWRSKFPKELVNPFYGMITIVEDTNKNRKLDEKEYDKMQSVERIMDDGTTYGSFKTEKNKNYIVMVSGMVDSTLPMTLWPYVLNIAPVNLVDEDKGSVVKNNIPSKPLALKASGKNQLKAAGYLNAGVPNGDEDWYVLKLDKDANGKIELAAGVEIDGTLSLYKDGKLVAAADYYPEGDNEVVYFHLKKGTYHLKVRDVNGNSTLNPYTVTVTY